MTRGRKDPAFLFYAGDWLLDAHVQAMTFEQRGAYLHLLCVAWLEGGIPQDLETVRAILGMRPGQFRAAWKRIGPCWFEREDGVLINRRQEEERETRQQKAAEMRARGQAGGKQSAEQRASGWPSRDPSRGQAEPQAESKPSTSTEREVSQLAKVSPLRTEREGDHSPESARARDLVADVAKARRAP